MTHEQIKEDLLFIGSLELGEGHNVESLSAFHRIKDYIANQKNLLESYQFLNENTNDYDLNPDEVDEIHNKIYELEAELK